MAHLLAAARVAVRHACRLSRGVQATLAKGDTLAKADASPVTTADFGVQAVVSLSLRAQLGDAQFRLLAEEDAATLRGAGGALLVAVVAAVNAAYPRAAWARERAVTDGGGDAPASDAPWTAAEVLDAIDAGAVDEAAGLPASYWILDPIDGTKGFVRGEQYCVGLAYAEGGAPVLGVLGCPNLPFPAGTAGGVGLRVGTLFTATAAGGGAFQEPVTDGGADGNDAARRAAVRAAPTAIAAAGVLCESAEAAHNDRATTEAVSRALGVTSPPIRCDSMVKYGLIARGDASIYLRFPRGGYAENVWDHAAGQVVVEAAGGRVSDSRGARLDFGGGSRLRGNVGVIATNGVLHDAVLAAVAGVAAGAAGR